MVDAMAEIRGGSLERNYGRGLTAATASRAWSSPKRAQAGGSATPSSDYPSGTCSKTTLRSKSRQTLLRQLPQSRAPPGSSPASGLRTSASSSARALPSSQPSGSRLSPGYREAGRGVPEAHGGLAEVRWGAGVLLLVGGEGLH